MSVNNGRPRPARKPHVVVIGGGYAGALAANRLQQNRDIAITIVNPRPVFVERGGPPDDNMRPRMPPSITDPTQAVPRDQRLLFHVSRLPLPASHSLLSPA